MRQMMRDAERTSQQIKSKETEREEEMQTLRTRISVTTKQLSIAQVNEKNAVDVAVKAVEQEVAQVRHHDGALTIVVAAFVWRGTACR